MSTPAAVSPDATFALKFPSELAIPLAAVGVSDIPTISMMIPPINGGIAFLTNFEKPLNIPSNTIMIAPGIRLPIIALTPMVAPIIHIAPSGTYDGPCMIGYFMKNPACNIVAIPHAKKLI